MTVYLIMLALMILVLLPQAMPASPGLMQEKKYQKSKKLTVWILFFILAFVAAFRYGVGTDFYAYYKTSGWTNQFQRGEYSDPGFTLFAIVCRTIFGDRNGSLTIGAAIVTCALFVFTIAKRSENLTISILLFVFAGCFLGMFNGVRQYLSTAILFAGHHFVLEKKPIKWLLVVLLAASMHVTAILMFFIYFICNWKCDWKLVLMYFALAVVLLFAYEPLFDLVGALKQDEIDTSYEYMSSQVNILRILVQCVPIILLFFVDKEKVNNDKDARFLFNICLLNGAFAVAAMNSPYLSRFWIYTSCFQVLMYPKILSKMGKENKPIFTFLLLACYAGFWAYEVLNSTSLVTFKWIFNYL